METIKIYLAGACKNVEDEGRQWREKTVQMFNMASEDLGVTVKVINPIDFFSYAEQKHQSDHQVKSFYLDQVAHSRIVLVNLNNTENSCGTCMEVQKAVDEGIPVIGFGTENIYPWLKVDCQCIFGSMLQAIDYILDYYCI